MILEKFVWGYQLVVSEIPKSIELRVFTLTR